MGIDITLSAPLGKLPNVANTVRDVLMDKGYAIRLCCILSTSLPEFPRPCRGPEPISEIGWYKISTDRPITPEVWEELSPYCTKGAPRI